MFCRATTSRRWPTGPFEVWGGWRGWTSHTTASSLSGKVLSQFRVRLLLDSHSWQVQPIEFNSHGTYSEFAIIALMKKGEGDEYIIKHLVYNVYVSWKYTLLFHSQLSLKNKMTTVVTVHMCKVWKSHIFWTSLNSNSFLLKIHAVQYAWLNL